MTMDYKEGDLLEYRTFMDELRTVRVIAKDEIKPGHFGFDGVLEARINPFTAETELVTAGEVWGYDDQIVRVVERVS
jgi:hypothetical protein